MSISQSIITWLCGFDGIDVDEGIDTDLLAANAAACGLYKTPQTNIVSYIDGSRDITAYYSFCARQRAAQDAKRRSNQEWMEALEGWVRRQQLSRNLPALDGNRACQTIFVANSFALQDAEKDEAVYQLTLAVNYTEKAA